MRVAVVGSGVSGLAATWLLNEHSQHEVHVYEADSRPGGHANTVAFKEPGKPNAESVDIDSGFIVFNLPTYPNFARFLSLCNIPWKKTEMTFSVSRDRGAFEWAGKNPFTLFCQLSNFWDSSMWRMIWDIFRFNANASAVVARADEDILDDMSLGEYLTKEGYSEAFVNNYILPMTACIWSTPPNICALDFPVRSHIRFMYNHHLLQLVRKPPWLTIDGGSKKYVKRILSKLPSKQLHLSTPIVSVTSVPTPNDPDRPFKVKLVTRDGRTLEYDHVIMATHANTTLELLSNGESGRTELERKILSGFGWAQNEVVVHSDIALLPVRKVAWSCWNFLTTSSKSKSGEYQPNVNEVTLTYDMNQLQHVPEKKFGKVLCTLNPLFEPSADKVVHRTSYEHPMYIKESVWSQEHLHEIQNTRGLTYAGAWTKHGFHEDGFTSGMVVACEYLGVKPPFAIRDADRPVTFEDSTYAKAFDRLEMGRRLISVWLFASLEIILMALGVRKGKTV